MEYHLLLDRNDISLTIRTSGGTNLTDFEALHRELLARSRRDPNLDILFDNRNLNMDAVTSDRVRAGSEMLTRLSDELGTGRWAIVMGSERDYGLARMWEHYTDSGIEIEIKVFRSVEEAEKWLKG